MSACAEPFLVTGGTGNVGREVARALRERGLPVRLALHRAEGRSELEETVRLDFTDPSTFGPALVGTRGIFLMRPNPILGVKRTLNRFIDVAVKQGISHCVFLSVAGAEDNSFVPHHAVEQHLMRSSLRYTFLRAGFFAQNLLGPYRSDIQRGTLVLPSGDARVAYVDAADLGDVAALALSNPGAHAARGYYLTGPDSLTFAELTRLLSELIGRNVRYQSVSPLKYWRHCRAQGLSRIPSFAYTLIHTALRNGSAGATSPVLAQLLGRPGRSMRDFILRHRDAWNPSTSRSSQSKPGATTVPERHS